MSAYTRKKLNHVVFIRHGESEGNLASRDESVRTDSFDAEDSFHYRLTERGRGQAQKTGEWINSHFPDGFDTYICSPYARTQETAALLGLAGAEWIMDSGLEEANDQIHEPYQETDPECRPDLHKIKKDAAQMHNYRKFTKGMHHVESFLVEFILNNTTNSESIVVVCHANVIKYIQFRLEHLTVDHLLKNKMVVRNCEVFWYTKVNPNPLGAFPLPPLVWFKTTHWCEEEKSSHTQFWKYIKPTTFTNKDLLKRIEVSSPYLSNKP